MIRAVSSMHFLTLLSSLPYRLQPVTIYTSRAWALLRPWILYFSSVRAPVPQRRRQAQVSLTYSEALYCCNLDRLGVLVFLLCCLHLTGCSLSSEGRK